MFISKQKIFITFIIEQNPVNYIINDIVSYSYWGPYIHHVSIEKKIEFIFQNLIRQKYCSFQINDEALLVKPSFYHLMLDFNYSSIIDIV